MSTATLRRAVFGTLVSLAALPVGAPPAPAAEAVRAPAFTDADYQQHIARLKTKIPAGRDFSIVVQRPFVVIGDEPAETVQSRADGTIKWAIDQLKAIYFKNDPDRIIDIWLFKDKESYDKHTKEIFGDSPRTPYGYYSRTHGALIMNISTGGGTLVHEIVHPFVAANFPECPAWFNEGLASLYEMCGEERGRIQGYTNWRLPNLQRAIRVGGLVDFETLCGTTTQEFYTDEHGTNYGHARYLCYYLQEQGKLADFYHRFRKDAEKDPTGYATLQAVLGERDMAEFQKRWEAYVLKLKWR